MAGLALGASLALAGVLTFELVLANERATLDRSLVRQRDHVASELRAALEGSEATSAEVTDAAARFVDIDPPSDQYVTVLSVDGERLVGATRTPALDELATGGGLDGMPLGVLGTAHTDAGDLRVLSSELLVDSEPIGDLVVAGPLAPARTEAFAAAQRLAIAAVVSLVVGIVLVWLALGRVLGPLRELTTAAAGAELVDLRRRVQVRGDDEVADLADEFNAMLGRLEQAAAEREQLLATISHELRTPLAVAAGHLELAAHAADEGRTDPSAISIARTELTRLNRLVGDLLALGRSGQAGFLHRRPTSAAALAREVEVRVDGLGMDTVTVAPAPDTAVDIDADRLMQAVLNCIVNAVEHNPTGTTVDVVIDVTDPDPDAISDGIETLVIRVEDDGAGIPPEVAEIAFEPFTVGVSERDRLRSSGLGLAVVAAVATAHGGTAALQPADRGTIVELRLPAHPPTTTHA